jgi:hypothetical protein
MEKIICDRCGHEIRTEAERVGLDVTFAGEYKGYDLCPSCGETFFHFLRTKPEEPDGQEFRRLVENFQKGLPADAPIGAKAASYEISDLSKLLVVPPSTLRKMLRRADVDSFIGVNRNNQPLRCYTMDEAAWHRLMDEMKKYRPRH